MNQPSVLIVDDNDAFRAIARDILDGSGFDVVGEAADARSAVAEADRLRPSLVLLDIRLPDRDGFEVTRRLRLSSAPPVVVLVSTMDTQDVARRVRASGAAGFITKSKLSGDTLRALVRGHEEERT